VVERCAWCGVGIHPDEGFRLAGRDGAPQVAFCRLEHVVPWAMRKPDWHGGPCGEEEIEGLGRCAHCAEPLGEEHIVLVRHRGQHRIGDAFCEVSHLLAWAKAGGRYRV